MVRGPIGALLGSLARIGWTATTARHFRDADGNVIDLLKESPATVEWRASRAAQAALWRRLQATPGMGQISKPRLEPIIKLLARKCGPQWRPRHSAVLRSLAINSQWTQARLHEHGLVDDGRCRLCMVARGTLVHRWECDATREWWRQNVPEAIADLHRRDGVLPIFVERAIAPSLEHLLPPLPSPPSPRRCAWIKS